MKCEIELSTFDRREGGGEKGGRVGVFFPFPFLGCVYVCIGIGGVGEELEEEE